MSGDIVSLKEGIRSYFEQQGKAVPLSLDGKEFSQEGNQLVVRAGNDFEKRRITKKFGKLLAKEGSRGGFSGFKVEIQERENLEKETCEKYPVQTRPNYPLQKIPLSRRFFKDVYQEDIILHGGNKEGVEALGYSLENCVKGDIQNPLLFVGSPGTGITTLLSLAINRARKEKVGGEYFNLGLLIQEFKGNLIKANNGGSRKWCEPDFGSSVEGARVVSFDDMGALSIGSQKVIARKVNSILEGGIGGYQQLFLGITGEIDSFKNYIKEIANVSPDLADKISRLERIPMGFPSKDEIKEVIWNMFKRSEGVLLPSGIEKTVHYIIKIAPPNPSIGNLESYLNQLSGPAMRRGSPLTSEEAEKILLSRFSYQDCLFGSNLSIEQALKQICEVEGISEKFVLSSGSRKDQVKARRKAMYALSLMGYSIPEMAVIFPRSRPGIYSAIKEFDAKLPNETKVEFQNKYSPKF